MSTYENDKNIFLKWLSGVAASLVIIILTGIYTKLDTLTQFMIKSEIIIQQIQDKNTHQDSQIKELEQHVFIKPKETNLSNDDK